MKKLLVLAVLCLATSAFATKARQKALSNAMHLKGTQTVYTSPYHILELDNFVAVESGLTAATTVDNGAEGSVLFNVNDSTKMFVSLGHLDEAVQSQRRFFNAHATATFKPQQNAVEVLYGMKGDLAWAAGLYYSNFNDKTPAAAVKESSTGLRLAASHGDFKWKLNLGLTNTAENEADATNRKFKGDLYGNLGLRFNVNTLRYGFDITTWGVKGEDSAGLENQSHTFQSINLRVVNVEKQENGEFFCGAGLEQVDMKNRISDKKFNRLVLPVLFGVETKANDWLVLRGSITQTVLIAQSKNEAGYASAAVTGATGTVDAEFASEANNTAAAIGAGLVFGKVTIDGTLKGLIGSTASQNINSADLLAQVGAVYRY